MKKALILPLTFVLTLIATYLIYKDSYFGGLVIYIIGLMYIFDGYFHKSKEKFHFSFFVGIFIITITFGASFIAGYIDQQTIALSQDK